MLLELFLDHADWPLTGGVELKDPDHPRRALWIKLHSPHLATIVVAQARVDVPERCQTGRATILCFLEHALLRLGGEVTAVELGDRTHDAMQEHSARRLVDILTARHQLCPSRRQRDVDLDVVHAVACQPVDLVDDDVVDMAGADEAEHPLQRWAVG
nr:hypothetical protein [Flexivirga caeni]